MRKIFCQLTRKLKSDIWETVIVLCIVSARRILYSFSTIIRINLRLDPISCFPVIENSTDFSMFLSYAWMDKFWVFRFFLDTPSSHPHLYACKFSSVQHFWKYLRIFIRESVSEANTSKIK